VGTPSQGAPSTAGQTVRIKGDELLVMREEDIMGVVEGR
jgi:co-chaperonin GroES (HSP10)